jgi:hypothetical protein
MLEATPRENPMRRAKGFEWILLAAVLAVPAFLCGRWSSEIKKSAAPATRPTRTAAAAVPKAEPPAIKTPPPKPPEPVAPPAAPPNEPVLLAMRDPTISPYDRIAMMPREAPPEAPAYIPPPPPPPRIDAGIRLEGVILAADQPRRAIVNGSILEEGGTVKGAKVLKIDADGVEFGKRGKRFTKRLGD